MTISSIGGLDDDAAAGPIAGIGRGKLLLVILLMTVRLLIGFAFIVFFMSLVPKKPGDPVIYPIVAGILGIGIYIWFFRRQVRGVYKARYPTLRAIESLILVAAMFLAIFSMVYTTISVNDPNAFTEPLNSFSSYYFSLTVLATVGFGDIAPNTVMARSFAMVQMALDIAFIAVIIKVMSGAARKAIQQRAQKEVEAEDRAAEEQTKDHPSPAEISHRAETSTTGQPE
jgi:voltage-gated potassium channel